MVSKKILLVSAIGILALSSCNHLANSSQASSQSTVKKTEVTAAANQSFDYQDYQEVLQAYVNAQGLVDYTKLQANRDKLDQFNQSLGTVSPEVYDSWTESAQIAFLINAYNAFTLQSIIDQNPLKESIRDISGVWNKRKFSLAGSEKTLDNIEHDILRKDFNEPRIHVALVCAAMSCPPLLNQPYTPEQLESQLTSQTARFGSSDQGLQIDRENNRVYLSSIFKWYGKDFIQTYGVKDQFAGNEKQRAVLNYFSPSLDPQTADFIKQGNYKVKYLDYDWSLNKQL